MTPRTLSKRLRVLVAASALVSGAASAVNLMPLGDLPIRYMTEEDRQIFRAAAARALEKNPDGATSSWENPKTGAHGELTPRASFERDGRPCRDLEVANSARGRSNRIVLAVCRQDDGDWKVEPQ